MSLFSKLRGTIETIFQIGLGGPNVKNNVGAVEMRNAADAAFVITRGADPVGANDYVTKGVLPALLTGELLIGASSIWASITNGASGISQIETATNKVNTFVVDFLTGVQSFAEVAVPMPSGWDGGTVSAIVYWLANSASTNSVTWGVQGRAYADAATFDQAYGTAAEVTDANTGTNNVNQSGSTGAITVAGTPAGGQWLQLRIYRLGSGGDNLAATARLLGFRVLYGQV